ATATNAGGVGKHVIPGRLRCVLVNGHQAGHSGTLCELPPDQVARALRGDHADVHPGGGLDLPEADREAVGEHQEVAVCDPVGDLLAPDLGLLLVGNQDHPDVAPAACVPATKDLESPRRPLSPAWV